MAAPQAKSTLTDEELKERFNERQRNRRLEDFDADLEQFIEIDDPFAIFKNAEKPNSDNEDSDEAET